VNRPRSLKAKEFRPSTICLQILVGVLLFFAPNPASGQVPSQQTPSVRTMQSVLGQILKRVRSGEVAHPDRNLPTHDSADQPQNPDNPTKINPPSRVVPLFVTVPNVVGRPTDDALRLIRSAKLRPGRIEQAESTESVDRVIHQSLKPDTQVLIGSVIDIVVAQPQRRTTIVPRLIGRQKDEAVSAISAAELKLGSVGQKESAEPADQVIRQSLRPGSRVPVGQVIDIVTALQETTTVPNLVGDSKDEASNIISDARLKLGSARQEESEKPPDQVIRQSLRPGSRVPVGQVIEIAIAVQETTTVPNLVGRSKDQASSLISDARLKLGSVAQEESAEPVGQVTRQSLAPGSPVPVGQAIDLVLAHQETAVVPNLVGHPKDQAMSLISGARLKLGNVGLAESAKPVDEVLQQSLKPGTRVPVGQPVDIVVAQLENTIVPNLSGLQLEEVFRKIASAKLQLGNVSPERLPESNKGVLRQTPEAGRRVPVDTKVDLVIATDVGSVKVPNLVGRLREEATELLTAVGLRQGAVREKAAARPRGEVLAQTPAAGVEVPLGAMVEVFTSAPLQVPNVIGDTRDEASTALSQAGFKIGTVKERFSLFHTTGKVFIQEPGAGRLLAAPESVDLVVSTGIPTWAVASFLLLAGTAVGVWIRGRTQTLWHRPPPAEQSINWSTRVQRDIGSQQIEHGTIPVGADIRVRPIIDRGTQSIQETPAVRSDRAA
jgi:beta-lactam-binding protein with PASTA domain